MIWTILALLSAASFSALDVLDKRLITRHMPTVTDYYIWVGATLVITAMIVLLATGIPSYAKSNDILIAYGAGLCWGIGIAATFFSLRFEEASRVVAIYHVFPVFVALLAVAFLNESLNLGQWLAIVVVVLGSFLISFRKVSSHIFVRLNRSFPILISASFMFALAHFASKAALDGLPVDFVFSLRNLGVATPLLVFAKPSTVARALQVARDKRTAVLLFPTIFIVSPVSVTLTLVATSLGPVSLVATIVGARPFFTFIYSSILSVPRIGILDEPLGRETLTLKFVSIGLIIGGISALRLLQ